MVKTTRVTVLLAGLVLVLSACGRAPGSGTNPTPSARPASPSATAQPVPLAVAGATLHPGEVGLPYTPVTYAASGGTDPFLWTVSSGALPGGLSLGKEGTIAGTPTAAGWFSFTVEVTDSAMATANITGQITIAHGLTYHYLGGMASHGEMDICLYGGRPSCAPSMTDERYAPFAAVSGGIGPYTSAVVSGTLPPGTHLNGLALAGTYENTRMMYRFTVAVKDAMGATVLVDAVYNVFFTTAGP